jgi:hypothetical protein
VGNSHLELTERVLNLKEERGAVILAPNYQSGEVQDIADLVGDSLDLSQRAAQTDARVIVFCGGIGWGDSGIMMKELNLREVYNMWGDSQEWGEEVLPLTGGGRKSR